MSNKKATAAAVLIMAMFAAILMLFYLLGLKAVFFVIAGALAMIGAVYVCAYLIKWLSASDEKAATSEWPDDPAAPEILDDEIRRQINKELGGDDL